MLQIKLLTEDATVPTRGSKEAAGWDLYATSDFKLSPGERVMHPVGLSIAIPSGFVAMIRPRSGLAVGYGVDVLAGVVDSDYRGEVAVVLINHGNKLIDFEKGDRIAQMVIQEHHSDMPLMVVEKLSETVRGDEGFGSTGS